MVHKIRPIATESEGRWRHLNAPSAHWLAAGKPVLLTFDDGPSQSVTPRILEILRSFDIRAVFFVLGARLDDKDNRRLVEGIARGTHLIGNHSYTHVDLTTVSPERVYAELECTRVVLESIGIPERLFRPPYGNVNETVTKVVQSLGYCAVGWNADTNDWKQEHRDGSWVDEGLKAVAEQRESVVLMHDIHESTADGLERFIDGLLRLGCTFPSLFCDPAVDGGSADKVPACVTSGSTVMSAIQFSK